VRRAGERSIAFVAADALAFHRMFRAVMDASGVNLST
jgi:hypothetical protein